MQDLQTDSCLPRDAGYGLQIFKTKIRIKQSIRGFLCFLSVDNKLQTKPFNLSGLTNVEKNFQRF